MKKITIGSDTVISRDVNLERYLRDIRKIKPLTYAEERSVIIAAKSGNKQAFDLLITSNLKFVVSCAKEYQLPGVDIIDLISAGNIGLIRALEKFDMSKEIKFISYAVWWIKNDIIEYLKENVKTIRLPFNQQNEIRQYLNVKEKLEAKFETNLNTEQVEELTGIKTDYFQHALPFNNRTASLNDPINDSDEGDSTLEDLVADPQSDFTTNYDRGFQRKSIDEALEKLPKIQRDILTFSFGLNDGISRSNEDIAEQLNLTAERIRQIRKQALETLKGETNLTKVL